jgi:hypothetical protein
MTENQATTIEEAMINLKNDISAETGEVIEAVVLEEGTKEATKAKKSKKVAEKKEKEESPLIRLTTIVEELGIEGLDAKNARKILRREVKTGEGKSIWAWETTEEADKIKEVLRAAFENSKIDKVKRAEDKALKAEEKATQKEAQKEAQKSKKAAPVEEGAEDEEEPEVKPVKSSKRKSSRNV